jgi:tyrosyl-tRNA synthetase
MYGKIMTLQDELIADYFELCTDVPLKEVEEIRKAAKKDPRELKARLAREIVTIFHSKQAAQSAEKEFNLIFREKKNPSEIEKVLQGRKGSLVLVDLLVEAKLASSKSDARRLISQGGVKVEGNVQDDPQAMISLAAGTVIQVGKRRFAQIV